MAHNAPSTRPRALMEFAVPFPAEVTSINHPQYIKWYHQYRSSDDTTYNTCGNFRYKSNFLRKAGYTYKKAIQAWENSKDVRYATGSDYRKAKDKADREELGTIQSWLDEAGWDENAPEVVEARKKEAIERLERAGKKCVKAASKIASPF